MKKLIGKIKLRSSNLPRKLRSIKLIFLMNIKLQMNLMLSLQTLGVYWQVKFQILQHPSNPTKRSKIVSWKQNNNK